MRVAQFKFCGLKTSGKHLRGFSVPSPAAGGRVPACDGKYKGAPADYNDDAETFHVHVDAIVDSGYWLDVCDAFAGEVCAGLFGAGARVPGGGRRS